MNSVKQSADLMRFISTLNIDPSGDVIINTIDTDEPNFISRYYTPNLKVGEVGAKVNTLIKGGTLEQTSKKLNNNTLTILLINSNLKVTKPYLYTLAQSILLEAFSLVYAIEEDTSMLLALESSDLKQTMQNVKYLTDALGADDNYTEIVSRLYDLNVAIGYIENQLPLLKEGEFIG